MSSRGKSVNLYFMDGDSTGRIKCTVPNWTGTTYRIPRTELEKCRGRDDLMQSGVYFLFGATEDTGDLLVYIGQAGIRKNGEGVLYRLQEHKRNADKDYWTEAVVFTTSNNSFGPTEVSYLEHRFCALALEAKRYIVKNGNDPNIGNVTEEKESELEEFIDYARLVMGALGHKIFEPLIKKLNDNPEDVPTAAQGEIMLFFKRRSKKSGSVIEASCLRTSEGFVVKRGSHIELKDSDSIPPGIKSMREAARTSKLNTDGVLLEDMLFNSPSYAAAFVIGGHVNGLTEWKTADGKTLKELEAE